LESAAGLIYLWVIAGLELQLGAPLMQVAAGTEARTVEAGPKRGLSKIAAFTLST